MRFRFMSIRKMLVAAEAANLLGLGFFEKERPSSSYCFADIPNDGPIFNPIKERQELLARAHHLEQSSKPEPITLSPISSQAKESIHNGRLLEFIKILQANIHSIPEILNDIRDKDLAIVLRKELNPDRKYLGAGGGRVPVSNRFFTYEPSVDGNYIEKYSTFPPRGTYMDFAVLMTQLKEASSPEQYENILASQKASFEENFASCR